MEHNTYYANPVTADHLGDTDGFTEAQVAEIIRRLASATVGACDALGVVVVWQATGGSGWLAGHGDSAMIHEVAAAIDDACEAAMDAWYAQGCPDASGATTTNVASALGITDGRVRQLASELGVGRRWGRDWVFTPEDVAQLRGRNTKRGPKKFTKNP